MNTPITGGPAGWLACAPWLAGPELAALGGGSPRTTRHQLARLVATGQARRLVVAVTPWPRSALYALARPADPLPAPLRLVRLELLRALHTLLCRLAPPGTPPNLVARLRGEADGPPPAGAPHPLAGLADAWLVCPATPAGLLLRWDDGERHDRVERQWLADLLALAPYTPPVAVVCATPAALRAWRERLTTGERQPPLRLVLAADLARPRVPGQPAIWRDVHGRAAPAPSLAPLLAALWRALAPPAPDRRLGTLAAHRLALGAKGLTALRAVARQPLLTLADLAWLLTLGERTAATLVARLTQRRLLHGLAVGVDRRPALWVTRAGLRLLAAAAGEPPARYRRQTGLVGGAVAGHDQPGGNRVLGRLARHPRHTLAIIRLHQRFLHATRAARRAGQPIELLAWQGPVLRPVYFPTREPALLGWSASPRARAWGKVEPDARARLALGERRLTLLIEWDRGTEGTRRLTRKLRHYVGWGAAADRGDAVALFVTTTTAREALVHRLTAALAARPGGRHPPLWTTTIARVARQGPLGAIWWAPRAAGRRALVPARARHGFRPTTVS